MKKIFLIITFALLAFIRSVYAQNSSDTVAYLITCNPGTEVYSIYGHSALRIVDNFSGTDMVYNWGVFDFGTPNFAWKFACGRLDYMLESTTMERFLQTYHYEERGVMQQKINLTPGSIRRLVELVNENMKPENVKYRYDFFNDNCATRIRDILEKSSGGTIHYPPDFDADMRTFRDLLDDCQKPYPWLRTAINIALGLPANKKATFSQSMFLPLELQERLSQSVINIDGRMVPLLQNPSTIVDYAMPAVKSSRLLVPETALTLLLIVLVAIIPFIRKKTVVKSVDIFIFFAFSIFAALMLFFNFFTGLEQTKMNIHILWLNPFIIPCLVSLLVNRAGVIWFRLVFFTSVLSLAVSVVLMHSISAIIPACLILAFRSSARSAFSWNPFTVNDNILI
ncbi:MAG: DUF4105 domain-containing protein [Bacteroidales bacterium]|jgi:hypothetical protein|nr:DUF4105 domain-containing protein [Bacteroidales bacterium]